MGIDGGGPGPGRGSSLVHTGGLLFRAAVRTASPRCRCLRSSWAARARRRRPTPPSNRRARQTPPPRCAPKQPSGRVRWGAPPPLPRRRQRRRAAERWQSRLLCRLLPPARRRLPLAWLLPRHTSPLRLLRLLRWPAQGLPPAQRTVCLAAAARHSRCAAARSRGWGLRGGGGEGQEMDGHEARWRIPAAWCCGHQKHAAWARLLAHHSRRPRHLSTHPPCPSASQHPSPGCHLCKCK